MRIAGVICEYNPFHNGHKHQLELINREFDGVVCVMSGSFVQRGEPALFDKWHRAEAALLNGADLVLELPVRFSLSAAPDFARGAAEILESTGVISALCFGSECADIKKLTAAAEILVNEPPAVSEKLRALLGSGMSYPAARAAAYDGIIDSALLSSPNDILGLEYICALLRLGSSITPIAMPRRAVGHNSAGSCGIYASASHIREMLARGEAADGFMPYDFSDCPRFSAERLGQILRYKLICEKEAAFSGMSGMEPGLAERFVKHTDAGGFSDIISAVKTKRYTKTRLQRTAISVILGIKGGYRPPEYLRILGMTDTGRQILAKMRTASRLPAVNKAADFKSEAMAEDIRATDIASLCADRPLPSGRDFTTSPVYITRRKTQE